MSPPALPRRAALAIPLVLASARARAQDIAPGPIRLVLGFAPGGGIDAFARLLARRAGELGGRTIIVENRSGAGGTIAAAQVARAAPDGTTVLLGEPGTIATPRAVFASLPYDPDRDLPPVMLAATQSVVLLGHNDTAPDLDGLIAAARARPGGITHGTAGAGNATHLFGADFARRAGADITHVHYRGGGQAFAAILSRDVNLGFSSLATGMPHIRSGAVRAFGLGEDKAFDGLPEVPIIASRLPGFVARYWYGLHAPAGTSGATIGALNALFGAALRDPPFVEALATQGYVAAPGTAEAYRRFIAEESVHWSGVAREAGVRPE